MPPSDSPEDGSTVSSPLPLPISISTWPVVSTVTNNAANIRSAYAEVAAAALSDPKEVASATVEKVQTQDDWQNTSNEAIAGIDINDIESTEETVISYDPSENVITIDDSPASTSSLDSAAQDGGE